MATITLTVEVTDTEQAILLNDLLSIDDWLQAAMAGKKNNCWKRMQYNLMQKDQQCSLACHYLVLNMYRQLQLVTSRQGIHPRLSLYASCR